MKVNYNSVSIKKLYLTILCTNEFFQYHRTQVCIENQAKYLYCARLQFMDLIYVLDSYKSWFFSGRNEYFFKIVHGSAYDEFPKTNEPCFVYNKFKLIRAILNSVKLIEGEVCVTKQLYLTVAYEYDITINYFTTLCNNNHASTD